MAEQITRERIAWLAGIHAGNDTGIALTELLERRDAEPLIERTAEA